MSSSEPIYVYKRGQGWVIAPSRTAQEILDAYTHQKYRARVGRNCTTCKENYANHNGDSCDYPYVGREWTD